MIEVILVPFLEAAVRTATPLAFAALGELVAERAGVINLGLEGAIIAGCLPDGRCEHFDEILGRRWHIAFGKRLHDPPDALFAQQFGGIHLAAGFGTKT